MSLLFILFWVFHVSAVLGLEQMTDGLVSFKATYKYGDQDMDVNGFQPDDASTGLPVYLWIMGTGDTYGSLVDAEWLKAMANRGFIAGAANYPNSVVELMGFLANDAYAELQSSWKDKASKIVPNAISTLCSQPRADCAAGVAVSGHSQGGFITTFSVQYENRTTAIMPLGIGCLGPEGKDNSGRLLDGLKDAEVSKHIPRQQRLYITGQADDLFSENCFSQLTYDCKGSGTACVRSDGSGYMTVPGGPHNFYSTCDPAMTDTKMKCQYVQSDEPWGLHQAAAWLSKAASPTKAIDIAGEDNVCEDQAIMETPVCTPNELENFYAMLLTAGLVATCCCCCGCLLFCVLTKKLFWKEPGLQQSSRRDVELPTSRVG